MASEFALIDVFVGAFAAAARGQVADAVSTLVLGPGDDAALLTVPEGEYLVATTDTLIAGRHFFASMPAECIGWRALAVNLSDLAAMGARPTSILVSLTLPEGDAEWLAACGRGMGELARLHGVALAGGNMSKGECAIGVTALGCVPRGSELLRSGGRAGDIVYVSGAIGSGAAGLRLARVRAAAQADADANADANADADADASPVDGGPSSRSLAWPALADIRRAAAGPESPMQALARYLTPAPRCELGVALRGLASACVDISDGLLADLGHLCLASGVAAHVTSARVPVALGIGTADALRAGDDYELCFTASADDAAAVRALAGHMGIALTAIGELVDGEGVWLDGAAVGSGGGYQHF